jgi:glutamine amidotransferase
MRIVLCDPGASNVRSVARAIERAAGRSADVSRDPDTIRRADVLVVPGQGHFAAFARAMEGGVGEALLERIRAGVPYLGICLGLQVLFESSAEAPGAKGLGVLAGTVVKLDAGLDPETGRPRALPHIGWNAVEPAAGSPIARAHYYFAHGYVAAPADASVVAGTTEYGASFPSAIAKDRILGVQFHPEKSQRAGLALLECFFASTR